MVLKEYDNTTAPDMGTVRFKEFVSLCMEKWKWFVASVLVCMLLAVLFLLRTAPQYTRSAAVLIKEEDNAASSVSSELGAFSGMGLFNAVSNVYNEQLALQSPSVMLKVVRRLHLDYAYRQRQGLRNVELYGRTLPVSVLVPALTDDDRLRFTLTVKADGSLTIADIRKNKEHIGGSFTGRLGAVVKTRAGSMMVSATPYFAKLMGKDEELTIKVNRAAPIDCTEELMKKFTASVADENASVINLDIKDASIERAEDILNAVIAAYQEDWVKDKNNVALSTSKFIDERLKSISLELGNVDNDISAYKSKNLIPDVAEAAKMHMENANQADQSKLLLNNQLYTATYLRNYLQNNSRHNQLLPANVTEGNKALEAQIAEYNTKQLERNKLVENSSTANPLVEDLDLQLKSMRQSILATVNNDIRRLNIQIGGFAANQNKNTAEIASSPTQAKHLLSVERQQKVKESLYIYLLQKREENQLSQAFTAYNTRIITPPMGKLEPTSPRKGITLLVTLLMGLILPIVIIYLRELLNTTVQGKKDLEKLSIPFIGEIPLTPSKAKGKDAAPGRILVQPKKRNMINEAFRVVRTNVEFMANSYNQARMLMVTSINPGSGKTFVSINLAAVFVLKGKRVVLLDADIRKASLSEYVDSPRYGVSTYLAGQSTDWRKLIVHHKDCEGLDIVPGGAIPPNPTELLGNGRLQQLVGELKQEYDLVLMDCAPVDIVADTNIIAGMADMTVFIVRSGLLERDMLPVIEEFYTQKKLKNMGLILNGSKVVSGKYGYSRHGYGYGYGYGSYAKEDE